jgi:hypothetical protein
VRALPCWRTILSCGRLANSPAVTRHTSCHLRLRLRLRLRLALWRSSSTCATSSRRPCSAAASCPRRDAEESISVLRAALRVVPNNATRVRDSFSSLCPGRAWANKPVFPFLSFRQAGATWHCPGTSLLRSVSHSAKRTGWLASSCAIHATVCGPASDASVAASGSITAGR